MAVRNYKQAVKYDQTQFGAPIQAAQSDEFIKLIDDSFKVFRVAVVSTTQIPITGAVPVIDGYQPVNGDLVLLTAEANGVNNKIYIVAGGVLTSYDPFDTAAQLNQIAVVAVSKGTTYATSLWKLVTDSPTIGTTNLSWLMVNQNVPNNTNIVVLYTASVAINMGQAVALNSASPRQLVLASGASGSTSYIPIGIANATAAANSQCPVVIEGYYIGSNGISSGNFDKICYVSQATSGAITSPDNLTNTSGQYASSIGKVIDANTIFVNCNSNQLIASY